LWSIHVGRVWPPRKRDLPKHDPEKWKPVFRKIMLKQKDSAGARFNSVESGSKAKPVCATMPQ
jgi:hypothetical protein